MKKIIVSTITVLIILTLSFFSIYLGGFNLTTNQIATLKMLGIVCVVSILFCFIVGEITRNNSQMDKLWSILPVAYCWIMAGFGGFKLRLIIIALIVTLWGIRLTFNFARKGAYKLKFWEGEEDYRWKILRTKKPFTNKFVWALFDLFFISIYQNLLVLVMTLPMLVVMESNLKVDALDAIPILAALGFLFLEYLADEEQWYFQETKKAKLAEGKTLAELDSPFNLGFNTTGLWSRMRHPNYLGEQGFWLSLYLFVIVTNQATYGIFNWSIIGPLLIVLLFMGSSTLGEKISKSKYPKYRDYQQKVFKYLPFRKYEPKEEEKVC